LVWNVDYLLAELGIDYQFEKKGHVCTLMTIKGVAPIDEANPEELAFCSSEGNDAVLTISRSRAGVILCNKSVEQQLEYHSERKEGQQLLIFLENPRLTAIRIIKLIHKGQKKGSIGISPRAVISKSATIGKDCSVGDFSAIGDNCEIDDNTIIYDRVNILDNSKIGRDCIIQPGVVIGADGFAYERLHETLELERFPHIGGVRIGNNVEICSNCSIARGSLSNTIIGNGTKLDALVHVAHNVQIGENCALTAGVIIGGSTIIGDTCWFGLNSTLKHKIRIGNKVIVGSGASVIDDVEDEDIIAGVPAKSIKHKVKTNQLFLMGGQSKHQKHKNIAIMKEQFKMACLLIGSAALMVPLLAC
jgi:UDP-3-O-[3-hydroxymyristoyl] glucosamine N-acyltransferase LpxD